jgi:hypothetical protein
MAQYRHGDDCPRLSNWLKEGVIHQHPDPTIREQAQVILKKNPFEEF